jgi:hypothetical protein
MHTTALLVVSIVLLLGGSGALSPSNWAETAGDFSKFECPYPAPSVASAGTLFLSPITDFIALYFTLYFILSLLYFLLTIL